MSSSVRDSCTETAREYYNSCDADNFYYTIWGGEDIHVGLYASPEESIFDASRKTVQRMISLLPEISSESNVLDIGAGYGGAARYLAKTYGCNVVALNLSEVENERDREMNCEQGLDHLIDVVDGTFEDLPYEDDSFDVVWSQDAILHSGDREKVLEEVYRVLKPEGSFVFTDPMKKDDCPEDVLEPILNRIQLETLGSPGFYMDKADDLGFTILVNENHSEQIANHYGRVLKETERKADEICENVSDEYITNMKTGLKHWVNGGRKGHLAWHIFVFQK
jgi:sarcosine/dimethylglycine N-methyltransferase